VIRGRLDAAQTTSENVRHWKNADNLSARSAYSPAERSILRDRSRYESENNSYYAGILGTVAAHEIGRGPRLQVLTGDQDANARVEKAWREWVRENNFVEMLRVAVMTYWRDGEIFFLRRYRGNHAPGKVGLKVCTYEAEQITNPYAFPHDPYVDDGIRIDKLGDPISYHILDHHPGDLNVPFGNFLTGQWYDAAEVIHLFRRIRPGQLRGIPRITPSLELFPKLRRHTLATLAAAEAVANWTLFVRTNSAAITPAAMPEDFVSLDFARAMLNFLPEGWEPFQLKAEQPTTNHEMFQRQTLMEICRCAGVPYLLMAGTSKDSNFSSAQMDVRNIWGPEVVADQDRLTITVLEKVWRWFLEDALMMSGLLNDLPAFDDIDHQWLFDPLPTTDNVDEATAGKIALQSGQVMPSELFARRGKDFDTEIRRGAADYGIDEKTLRAAHFAESFPSYHGIKVTEAKPTPGNDGSATRREDDRQMKPAEEAAETRPVEEAVA
jgi:capsid protein